MSIHAQLSEEAQGRLRSQQRNTTISSIIIAFLIVTIVALILWWNLMPGKNIYIPEIVTYNSSSDQSDQSQKPKVERKVQSKPASTPNTSVAKVIAGNMSSDIALPLSLESVDVEAMDFATSENFEEQWNTDDWEKPNQNKETSFFGQEVTGERIVFVIDYSASLYFSKRQDLMRRELAKSVESLAPNRQYQLIFFAGPAWVASDEFSTDPEKWSERKEIKKMIFKSKKGRRYEWNGSGYSNWKPKDRLQKPEWLIASEQNIKKSVAIIETHPLVNGTTWSYPLEMAFSMRPLPNTIVFMTDGSSGKSSFETAETYSKLARRNGVAINTISLMEPEAIKGMQILSEGTGGKFSLIDSKGEEADPENYTRNE